MNLIYLVIGITAGFPLQNRSDFIAPDIKLAFPRYIQFSAVSYCKDFYLTQQFRCAKNCAGDTTGTIMVQAVLNPKTEGAGYVAYNNKTKSIYVVFRGTANSKNILHNLRLAKVDADWITLDGRNVKVILTN